MLLLAKIPIFTEMKQKTAVWTIIIVVVAIVLIIIFAGHKKPSDDSTVRIGYLAMMVGAPHFIAADQGMYEKAGLKVEATQFQSSNQLYDALAQGQIDATPELAALPVLINQITDPGKVQITSFTEFTKEYPFDEVVVKNGSPIASLADLAGKKVGVFPGSTATAFLKDYLKNHGVDISKIEFVQIPAGNQIQAFEAGSIDALYSYQPNLAIILVKGMGHAISEPIFASYVDKSPVGVGAISTKFVQEHPDLAKRIVEVYDDAYTFLRTDDAKSREILTRDMNLEPAVAAKMSLAYHSVHTELDHDLFNKFTDILVSLGELKSKPDLSNIFYN